LIAAAIVYAAPFAWVVAAVSAAGIGDYGRGDRATSSMMVKIPPPSGASM
jgi:hypothetical protein